MTEGGAGPGLPRAPAQGPFRTQRQQRSLSLHGHRRPPSRGQGWAPWSFPGRSLPPPGFTVPGSPRRARSFEVEPPPGPRGSPPPPKRPETQLLGVVGLRGWWELVERVRGPSPTLARHATCSLWWGLSAKPSCGNKLPQEWPCVLPVSGAPQRTPLVPRLDLRVSSPPPSRGPSAYKYPYLSPLLLVVFPTHNFQLSFEQNRSLPE